MVTCRHDDGAPSRKRFLRSHQHPPIIAAIPARHYTPEVEKNVFFGFT